MNIPISLTPRDLPDFLLNAALVRPVFIWGAPGIGKSSLVEQFARQLGLPCVSLLGSQLAPEDIIGVPQIDQGKSRFCPPTLIARDEPYCLFLDELNACSHEVQKAFYSLIHERRIGEYRLHEGSVVIGAGNRAQDSAIVKPMSSALLNRMVHVHLRVDHRDWLAWAMREGIHPLVVEYIQLRPGHLFSEPPKHEQTFSTPRAWHMLSDALGQYGEDADGRAVEVLAYGCLTPSHAIQFKAFCSQVRNRYALNAIIKGEASWPTRPEEQDVCYFLAQSFRSQLLKELPAKAQDVSEEQRDLAHRAKALLKDLARVNHETAQMVVASAVEGDDSDGGRLPAWFLSEVARDLPRLFARENATT